MTNMGTGGVARGVRTHKDKEIRSKKVTKRALLNKSNVFLYSVPTNGLGKFHSEPTLTLAH